MPFPSTHSLWLLCFHSAQRGLRATGQFFQPYWGRRPQMTVSHFQSEAPHILLAANAVSPRPAGRFRKAVNGWRECELRLCLLIKPHLGPGRPRQRPSARDLLPPLHPQARPPEPGPTACRSRSCDTQASRQETAQGFALFTTKEMRTGARRRNIPNPASVSPQLHTSSLLCPAPSAVRFDARKKTQVLVWMFSFVFPSFHSLHRK